MLPARIYVYGVVEAGSCWLLFVFICSLMVGLLVQACMHDERTHGGVCDGVVCSADFNIFFSCVAFHVKNEADGNNSR